MYRGSLVNMDSVVPEGRAITSPPPPASPTGYYNCALHQRKVEPHQSDNGLTLKYRFDSLSGAHQTGTLQTSHPQTYQRIPACPPPPYQIRKQSHPNRLPLSITP